MKFSRIKGRNAWLQPPVPSHAPARGPEPHQATQPPWEGADHALQLIGKGFLWSCESGCVLPCTEGRGAGVNTEFVPCMGCPQGCVPGVLPQVCWQWELLGSFGRGYLCLGEVVAAASPSKTGKQNQEKSPGNCWGWPGSRCCSLV